MPQATAADAAATRGHSGGVRMTRAKPRGRAAGPQTAQGRSGRTLAGTTYLLGAGEPSADPTSAASLHVGARLLLRRGGVVRSRVEVRAPDGRLIGRLPADDADAVAELLDAGVLATARVAALVPAFRRQRVQLAIEVEGIAQAERPPTPALEHTAARGGP